MQFLECNYRLQRCVQCLDEDRFLIVWEDIRVWWDRRGWGSNGAREEVHNHVVSPLCEDEIIIVLTKTVSPAVNSQQLVDHAQSGELCN